MTVDVVAVVAHGKVILVLAMIPSQHDEIENWMSRPDWMSEA